MALAACGDADDRPPAPPSGPIPVDDDPIAREAYSKAVGAAVWSGHAREDDAYRRRLITHFTSVTPEDGMKWAIVNPQRGEYDFTEADAVVEFAEQTGKRIRGHPLVWDLQLPDWLEDGDFTPEDLEEILRRHVAELVGRYQGRIAEWDVVNEPLADDGSWEENIWYRALGEDYVRIAFEAAREADPEARLFINEIGAESRGPKSDAYLELAGRLRRDDVPIDGVGFQNHATGERYPSQARIERLFGAVRRMGLDVAITEMDVANAGDGRQASAYRAAATACAEARNCTGLTVWGVTDRWSWLGRDAEPLLFNGRGRPKPALDALLMPFSD